MGTMDSSAFRDKNRKDGSGKRDVYFNGPRDGKRHGHVVERTDPEGNRTYSYVRDVEGNVYADDSRGRGPRQTRREPQAREARQAGRDDSRGASPDRDRG
jgi:hypothetical protein